MDEGFTGSGAGAEISFFDETLDMDSTFLE